MKCFCMIVRSWFLIMSVLVCSWTTSFAEDALTIGALGTLTPASGLVRIAGAGGVTISSILVKQNDQITKGAVLARLSNYEMLQAELISVRLELDELTASHEHNLKLQGLARDNALSKLARAEKSLKQYLALSKNSQVKSIREVRRDNVADARHALKVKKAELAKSVAMYEVGKSKLELQIKKAELRFSETELKAPFDGVIVDIPGRLGAPATNRGVVVVADLSKMMVMCEVYEGDLNKIRTGQTAKITGKSLSKEMLGKVVAIGREIDVARKVATVWVELDNSAIASNFIGMEVSVSIQP